MSIFFFVISICHKNYMTFYMTNYYLNFSIKIFFLVIRQVTAKFHFISCTINFGLLAGLADKIYLNIAWKYPLNFFETDAGLCGWLTNLLELFKIIFNQAKICQGNPFTRIRAVRVQIRILVYTCMDLNIIYIGTVNLICWIQHIQR